jgi:serine protease Do
MQVSQVRRLRGDSIFVTIFVQSAMAVTYQHIMGKYLFGIIVVFAIMGGGGVAQGHEIHLKNGQVIVTDRIVRSGSTITYEYYGGDVSIDINRIASIIYEQENRPPPASGFDGQRPPPPSAGVVQPVDYDLTTQLTDKLNPRTPIEQANLAVVSITTAAGSGSGFFISEDGLIVTNKHLVRGSDRSRQQTEEQIEAARQQFAQWRRILDQDLRQLEAAEHQAARANVSDPTLRQWRRIYEENRREYEKKYKTFTTEQKSLLKKQQELAAQSRFTVTLADGTELSGLLYRVSAQYDLALLKINGYRTPFIKPHQPGDISLGQRVYAIGSPLQLSNSVTSGVVSQIRGDFVQTNAEIYPGNSGGPLVSEDGLVMGVNTMKLLTEKFEGLGFALRFDIAQREFGSYLE